MTSRVTQLVPHVHLGHTTIKLDKPVTKLYKYVHHRSQTGLIAGFRLKPSRARHVSSYFYKNPPDQTKSGLFCKSGRTPDQTRIRLNRVVVFLEVLPPAAMGEATSGPGSTTTAGPAATATAGTAGTGATAAGTVAMATAGAAASATCGAAASATGCPAAAAATAPVLI
jgi:hypothetical protein